MLGFELGRDLVSDDRYVVKRRPSIEERVEPITFALPSEIQPE